MGCPWSRLVAKTHGEPPGAWMIFSTYHHDGTNRYNLMPVSVPKPSQKSPNVFYFTSAPCRIGLSGLNVLKKNDKVGTEIAKNREIRGHSDRLWTPFPTSLRSLILKQLRRTLWSPTHV